MAPLDGYSFRARLQPALLVLFVPAASLVLLAPDAYRGIASLAALAGTFGCTLFLANLARRLGRATENRLIKKWGGRPSSLMLRASDRAMDASTKARRLTFLATHVPGWRAPDAATEAANTAMANEAFDGAVTWLIGNTRDAARFPLLQKENVSYGFWRNLRGLRPIGITSTLVTLLAIALSPALRTADWTAMASGLIALVALAGWMFAVTDAAVRDAAEAYGRALFECCDRLP